LHWRSEDEERFGAKVIFLKDGLMAEEGEGLVYLQL
jgi:hypothetical protein